MEGRSDWTGLFLINGAKMLFLWVMRKVLSVILIALAFLSLASCDQLRSLAGRPTSAELAQMKERKLEIEAEKAAKEAARQAAEQRRRQAVADSLSALGKIESGAVVMKPARNLRSGSMELLDRRYYVMIGSFGEAANAARLKDRAEAAGYPAMLFSFSSGLTAVAACATDCLADAVGSLERLRQEPFCPADAWLMECQW